MLLTFTTFTAPLHRKPLFIPSRDTFHSFSWPAKTSRFLDPSASPAPSTCFWCNNEKVWFQGNTHHRVGPSSPIRSSAIQVIALKCFHKASPPQQVAAKNDDCSKVEIREVCFSFSLFFNCVLIVFFMHSYNQFPSSRFISMWLAPPPSPPPLSPGEREGREEEN